ncbi:hypothetical protein [Bradyrhizobium sp. NFR13]|uniref:hypothetical protein n=1 Tax=Bradyrhizobium sp. NFR13 TaxID=1566285 RepID=UPI0011133A15|nr:hypothetical protein [Bradyrhizobium sp. NFR13]
MISFAGALISRTFSAGIFLVLEAESVLATAGTFATDALAGLVEPGRDANERARRHDDGDELSTEEKLIGIPEERVRNAVDDKHREMAERELAAFRRSAKYLDGLGRRPSKF